GQRGYHLHVGKAVFQIKPADQIAIGFEPIRIVDVGTAEKAQQIRFTGLDDVLEAIRRIKTVADEFDGFDAGLRPLDNRENEINAVVRLFDDLGGDTHVVAAEMTIDFGDALGVGLHHGTRQRAPRLGLDFGGKLLILDLLVALEGDAPDHRVLNDGHQQVTPGLADPDVLEQAGLDQRLQAVIDLRLIQA